MSTPRSHLTSVTSKDKFLQSPYVLVSSKHHYSGRKHDAATVWAENIEKGKFTVCLREMQNFDGMHENITVVSISQFCILIDSVNSLWLIADIVGTSSLCPRKRESVIAGVYNTVKRLLHCIYLCLGFSCCSKYSDRGVRCYSEVSASRKSIVNKFGLLLKKWVSFFYIISSLNYLEGFFRFSCK